MKAVLEVAEMKELSKKWKAENETVALVPTMGALHIGHLELVKEAKQKAERVIVSIFVNPTQFGPGEDFEKYPRSFKEDLELLKPLGVDAVFAPSNLEMYPNGFQTFVDNTKIGTELCGASRPGHFKGVCTVVTKLFRIMEPTCAFFGKKDYQQLKVIEHLNRDLHLDVEVIGIDTVRDEDGVAVSSRNQFLSESERNLAQLIPAGLNACFDKYESGIRDPKQIEAAFLETINGFEDVRLDFAEVRKQRDLSSFEGKIDEAPVVLVAAKIGTVRLIDNLELA